MVMRFGLLCAGVVAAAYAGGMRRTSAERAAGATLAIVNARIWTGDRSRPWAEALAVAGDRILAMGTTEEIRRLAQSADVVDAGGESQVRFNVAGAGPETAMVLGELYLRGDEWKFRAVGQGWDSGLAGLATDYGIDVADPIDDPHSADAPSAGHPEQAGMSVATATVEDVDASLRAGEPVEPLVVVDVDEVTARAAGPLA